MSLSTFFSPKTYRPSLHRLRICLLWCLAAWVGLPGCAAASTQLRIVVTTGMIGDAAVQIVGDKAQVLTLMGPGVDPHTYEPTLADMDALRQADLVFYNGLHLEGAMHFTPLARSKPVYAVSEALTPQDILADPLFPAGQDPHLWGDVQLWKKAVAYMSERLQAHDPAHAACYVARTKAYLAALEALDRDILDAMAQIPASKRLLITAHDAFAYFGRRYGLRVYALQGISTAMPPAIHDRMRLKALIQQHGITTVFTEATVSDKNMQAVIASCKAEGHHVQASGVLFSDSLGAPHTPAGTYIGMMRANARHIQQGLTL